MKKRTKVIIGAVVGVASLVIVAVIMWMIFSAFRDDKPRKTQEGADNSISVTIEVTGKEGNTTSYKVKTEALYLRGAMEDADGLTFSGTESSEYGMMVDTVNGVRADYTLDGAYWSFYINGDYCNYGIDSQPINDGDVFGIVYTPAQ